MPDCGQLWDDVSPPNPFACSECGGVTHCAEWCATALWSPPEPNPFGNPVIIEIRSGSQPQEDT